MPHVRSEAHDRITRSGAGARRDSLVREFVDEELVHYNQESGVGLSMGEFESSTEKPQFLDL